MSISATAAWSGGAGFVGATSGNSSTMLAANLGTRLATVFIPLVTMKSRRKGARIFS